MSSLLDSAELLPALFEQRSRCRRGMSNIVSASQGLDMEDFETMAHVGGYAEPVKEASYPLALSLRPEVRSSMFAGLSKKSQLVSPRKAPRSEGAMKISPQVEFSLGACWEHLD